MVINRPEYIERLTSKTGNGLIKVITGIRRCGKSYLLFNLFRDYLLSQGIEEECIIDIPLDDDDYIELRNPDNLKSYITQRMDNPRKLYYILIDEAQFAISSEEMKNKDMPIRLYGILSGLLRKGNAEVYITGSNSKFLSKDIRTEFRDRGDVIHISPLSFSEYYHASSLDKNDAWREYIYFGGLPHLLLEKNDSGKMNYLKGLNEKIYLADLKERYNLKDDSTMEELMKVLASSIGSLVNPRRISSTFISNGSKDISEPTIKKYMGYLEDAFIITPAERYDIKGRRYIESQKKYYFSDIGLRNALLNFRQQEESHIMENVIFNELIFRGISVDTGVSIKNVVENGKHTGKKLEIDFVVNSPSSRIYIQSALAIPDDKKMEQELAAFRNIPDSFRKVVITGGNYRPWYNDDGIMFIPLLDFLLDKNLLDRMF